MLDFPVVISLNLIPFVSTLGLKLFTGVLFVNLDGTACALRDLRVRRDGSFEYEEIE